MPWGWPFPTDTSGNACGCCKGALGYHIRKYTNDSSMTLLASQSDNHDCLGLIFDGTSLDAMYSELISETGTASGTTVYLRAVSYDANLTTVRSIHHYAKEPGAGVPARNRSVMRNTSDNSYAMTAPKTHTVIRYADAVVSSGDVLNWTTPMDDNGFGKQLDQLYCNLIDSSGNVYAFTTTDNTLFPTGCGHLYKFNSSGVLQWKTNVGQTNVSVVTPRLMTFDSSGNIWLSTTNGEIITVTPAGVATTLSIKSIDYSGSMESDGAGGVWVGVTGGIYRLNSSGAQTALINDSLLNIWFSSAVPTLSCSTFAVDSSNNVYGIIRNGTAWNVRKWSGTGSGTSTSEYPVAWTSPDIGWPNTSIAGPRAIAVDASHIYVGGAFVSG